MAPQDKDKHGDEGDRAGMPGGSRPGGGHDKHDDDHPGQGKGHDKHGDEGDRAGMPGGSRSGGGHGDDDGNTGDRAGMPGGS